MERRSLSEGDREEDRHHSHHDHSDYDFDPSNIGNTFADLKQSLRGSELRVGKRRRVQGASFAYWVDIYVEIDHALCNANGETCATGIGPKTLNYGESGDQILFLARVFSLIIFFCPINYVN
jgi:hypothetical protein